MDKLRPVEEVALENTPQYEDISHYDIEEALTQDRQAIHTLLREGVESKHKEYKVHKDGEYHFGDNQKTTGYNQALDDILTLVDELFSDKTDTLCPTQITRR